MRGLPWQKHDTELAGRPCWCCRVIRALLRCTSQQMLIKPTVMGGRGPCHIPELPHPVGECPGEPLCSSRESPRHPSLAVRLLQLAEGFRHPCPAFINPDCSPTPNASESVSLLALLQLPPLQHATEALQATRLTQWGAKVCWEVTMMITSSSADAPRNKNDC